MSHNRSFIESRESFNSNAKTISLTKFQPTSSALHPTVIVLYGSGGMLVGGPMFREYARMLARRGYQAFILHFFDRTDTEMATEEIRRAYLPVWQETICEGIDYLIQQENVDKQRIGLLGFSLGAYLALAVASQGCRVNTIVEFFGALPPQMGDKKWPATLILHGEEDSVVSVNEAYNIAQWLQAQESFYELQIYPQQGHGFTGAAGKDALQRTLTFFAEHL